MCFRRCITTILSFIACMTLYAIGAESCNISQDASFRGQEQRDIQNQVQQAKNEVQKDLVPEAISVIEETEKTIQFIKNKKFNEALSSLERATGKIDILLARHPKESLLPVDFSIKIIDIAPRDLNKIYEIEKQAKKTINNKDYPSTRALLSLLSSEIHVATYCLPLAYYPDSLKEAARLLESEQAAEANYVLETALSTLVVTDRVYPIPPIRATALLTVSEDILERIDNKEKALKFIDEAKFELKRSVELGYLKKPDEYRILNQELALLEDRVKKDQKTSLIFSSLKEKFRNFFRSHYKLKSPSEYLNKQ
jgi:hypothetical protein